jgi:phosphohistidine phosphatase SixA
MELIETSVGLPNTCSVCGKPIEEKTWFAEHVDGARSGVAGHKACMKKLLKAEAAEAAEEVKVEAATVIVIETEPEGYPTKASRAKAKAKAEAEEV